jgi:hypothetical protein
VLCPASTTKLNYLYHTSPKNVNRFFLFFIRYARKPQAFKPGDEWHPGTKPVLTGAVEENQA